MSEVRRALTEFDALILDMDGVVTDTASTHAAAWRQLFDEFLQRRRAERMFTDADYLRYVDGRPRIDGVVGFLASRNIELPLGGPEDPPGDETSWALANRKNELFLARVAEAGVRSFPTTLDLLRRRRARAVRTAVVTASRNAAAILAAAGAADLFDACVDGNEAERLALAGKPDPASFLEAARRLGVEPARCVVIEDALAGVEAGRRGGFGLVVGIDRVGQADALRQAGADVVVADVAELDPSGPWMLAFSGFDPLTEGTHETLLGLGNGYFGTRAAACEASADEVHYPGTYVAGVYNRLSSEIAGRTRHDESIVNLPNWLSLTFRAPGGDWFAPGTADVSAHNVELDVRRGLLVWRRTVTDADGRRTRLVERRLVSMAAPHVAGLQMTFTPENWSGRLEVRTGIDGQVTNANVADYRALAGNHLDEIGSGLAEDGETFWLEVATNQSKIRVVEAARTSVVDERGRRVAVERHLQRGSGVIRQTLALDVVEGQEATVEKVAAIHTSGDRPLVDPRSAALDSLGQAGAFDDLLADHVRAWTHLWNRFAIDFGAPDSERTAVNHNTFHVLQTLSNHTIDLDAGVPARGLHGEGYQGHVFWDELFVLPTFDLRLPELSRSLLLYRCRRLPQARRRARELGFRGALYPWQSGSDGREETPRSYLNPRSGRWMADHSSRQYHVNLTVAWNLWHYFEATGDLAFLATHGVEVMVEMARFWADLADYDPIDDRYDLRGVMGPDEFHDGYPGRPGQGIDNNAYVNVLTAWALDRAHQAYEILGRERGAELWDRLGLSHEELTGWDHIARRLRVPFIDGGILAQFEGYDQLEELDWEAYRSRYGEIGRLDLLLEAEGDTTNRYKLSKQADALMLFYLFSAEELTALLARLGYGFDPAVIPATVDYYLARTSHGSTLSRVAHAWVLARTDRRRSWTLLREALGADLGDTQRGTTREGIHLGAMAGAVDIIQRCYTGLDAREDVLWFNPQLPDQLRSLELSLLYRSLPITVHVDHDVLQLVATPCVAEPVHVALRDEVFELAPGARLRLPLRQARNRTPSASPTTVVAPPSASTSTPLRRAGTETRRPLT